MIAKQRREKAAQRAAIAQLKKELEEVKGKRDLETKQVCYANERIRKLEEELATYRAYSLRDRSEREDLVQKLVGLIIDKVAEDIDRKNQQRAQTLLQILGSQSTAKVAAESRAQEQPPQPKKRRR